MEDAAPYQPGDRIGSYVVEEVLGQGIFGAVYRAKHTRLDRWVVLSVGHHPEWNERLYQTADLLALLDHPNIVRLYDVGEDRGRPFMAIEWVDGDSLAAMIEAEGRIEVPALLRMLAALADGLHHAHERDVLHKDVKPGNIVVARTGQPVLVDFGFAAPASGDPLLEEDTVIGTPMYMFPEHFMGQCAARSDIWSLGVTMYRILTGLDLWKGEHPHDLITAIHSLQPVDLAALEDRAPDYVVEIVAKCLAKDPDDRYRSADELKRALEAATDFLERSEGDAAVLPLPREGETILTHVEYRESDLPGAFRHYRIGAYLGGGTYGDVFRATEVLSGRELALKILKHEHLANQEAVARFRREATLLSRLAHPNIVRVYNFGRFGATFLLAMEILGDRTLENVIRERAPLSVEEAVHHLSQALSGLAGIHETGIVHRDLKPSNLAVDGERVVVFDFGLASANDLLTLTRSGLFLGTAGYASPEQAAGRPIAPPADVYAAGVILYEMLTGETPHRGDDVLDVLMKIADEPPRPVTEHRTDLPANLVRLLMEGMLARSPDDRPTARQAGEALTELG